MQLTEDMFQAEESFLALVNSRAPILRMWASRSEAEHKNYHGIRERVNALFKIFDS